MHIRPCWSDGTALNLFMPLHIGRQQKDQEALDMPFFAIIRHASHMVPHELGGHLLLWYMRGNISAKVAPAGYGGGSG